jgi:hypothetical protein
MTTWQDLTAYIRSNYKIADEDTGLIKLIFETSGLRSQMVLLTRQVLMDGDEEWVQISSPVASLGSVNPEAFLRETGNIVCGGAALTGDFLVIQHSAPLINLDINEFERPLRLVISTADSLEKKLVGSDRF